MTDRRNRLLKLVNVIVALLSLGFVGYTLWRDLTWDLLARLADMAVLPQAALLALAYVGILLLPATAWYLLLGRHDGTGAEATMPPRLALKTGLLIYGITLLAKYMPGNVFHLIARQSMGLSVGMPGIVTAMATFLEVLLVVAAGGMISGLAALALVPTEMPVIGWLTPSVYLAAIAATACLPVLVILFMRYGLSLLPPWPRRWLTGYHPPAWHVILLSWLLYAGFVAASALLLWLIGRWFVAELSPSKVLFSYGLIYVLSYVAPGLPGGLGLREALTILALGDAMGNGAAGVAALCLRLVMMAGEIVLWLASLTIYASTRR